MMVLLFLSPNLDDSCGSRTPKKKLFGIIQAPLLKSMGVLIEVKIEIIGLILSISGATERVSFQSPLKMHYATLRNMFNTSGEVFRAK